ncbi:hypothetical protein MMC30_006006 [Trapelia coarctata]|nr:hypothetical protein [Trapelia coarctata]
MVKIPAVKPALVDIAPRSGPNNAGASNDGLSIDRSVLQTRANRGRQVLPTGYLDPTKVVIDDSDGEHEEDHHDDEEEWKDSADEDPLTKIAKQVKKKGLFKSPMVPPILQPMVSPLRSSHSTAKQEDHGAIAQQSRAELPLKPLKLDIDVSPSQDGPAGVHVETKPLVRANSALDITGQERFGNSLKIDIENLMKLTSRPVYRVHVVAASKVGFTSIPPELRVRIYRMLFRSENCIAIGVRQDFCRSSQFLRTCKLVHYEGRVILYRENKFQLRREYNIRGRFFDRSWSDIGYEDCYRFVDMIGPINLSMIRDVGIFLDDALPSLTPDVDVRRRRYINDQNLRCCLGLLAKHGQLQRIKLEIHGRRRLGWNTEDAGFLGQLKAIKADCVFFGRLDEKDEGSDTHVKKSTYPYTYSGCNLELLLIEILRRSIGHKVKQEGTKRGAA